jgi:hypothetical protein
MEPNTTRELIDIIKPHLEGISDAINQVRSEYTAIPDDLVRREEVKAKMLEMVNFKLKWTWHKEAVLCSYNELASIIDKVPVADADLGLIVWNKSNKLLEKRMTYLQRPEDNWNEIQAGMYVCPFCGATPHAQYMNFCAKCGAKLHKSKTDDTEVQDEQL